MSSDSEVDDLQRFEESRQKELEARAGLGRNQFQDEDLSEEEVLGIDEASSSEEEEEDQGQEAYYDQDDETVNERRSRSNRELDDNWGNTRDNYFGGEDDIGAEEGASEEEEEEALRLHQKELDEMDEADFVDEDDLEGWKKNADDLDEESAPQEIQQIDLSSMSASERREIIDEKFPIVNLLLEELSKSQEWERDLTKENTEKNAEVVDLGKALVNTYKGMIYSYFSLFTDRLQSLGVKGLAQLDEHPVNEGLLMSRQMWYNYIGSDWKHASLPSGSAGKKLAAALSDTELPGESSDEEVAMSENEDISESEQFGSEQQYGDALSDSDMADSDDDAPTASRFVDSDDEFSIAKPEAKPVSTKSRASVVGDFDETADTIEQQARAKNKQSLRFYTSQIGKEDVKKQNSYSGDVDLPYREREFERRQRLMAEAQKRGQQQKDALGEDDFDDSAMLEDGNDGDDSEYSRLKHERTASKEEKRARHAEAIEAARAGRIAEYLAENPNVDKRAINYQIEKNKGLTRKRKKENRNARVKKRVRYEAAQKRLKGVRKVYKTPEGPYQGELTGIRKNLTHSTKFKN